MHMVETPDPQLLPPSDPICPLDPTAPRAVHAAGLWCLVGIGGALWVAFCAITLGMLL